MAWRIGEDTGVFPKIGRLAVVWFWYARVMGILAGISHDF
jgi:hypothetical protein